MKIIKSIVLTKKKILCLIWGIAALAFAVHISPPAIQSVFHVAESERKLPIYCVDTQEQKVSISFDAAWGAYQKVRRCFLWKMLLQEGREYMQEYQKRI